MNIELGEKVTKAQVQELMKTNALKGELVNQIFYSINEELVSNDIIGNELLLSI